MSCEKKRLNRSRCVWVVNSGGPKEACVTWEHIGATWRIGLNHPCAAAMRPYVKLRKRHVIQRIVKMGLPVFAQLTLYTQPPFLCFTVLFNRPDTPKCPVSVGASTFPCNTCSLDQPDSAFQTASRSVQPFSHLSRQRVPALHNAR